MLTDGAPMVYIARCKPCNWEGIGRGKPPASQSSLGKATGRGGSVFRGSGKRARGGRGQRACAIAEGRAVARGRLDGWVEGAGHVAGHSEYRVEWLFHCGLDSCLRDLTAADLMSKEPKAYDLVIIGGGPAGIVGAATAKAAHKTVALVDNHRELGGAGINTGTVPSKTLRETALALSGIKARKLTGVDLSLKYEATVADFLRHEQHVRDGFNTMISQQLKADQADVFVGTGSFVDPHTIRVQTKPPSPPGTPAASADGAVLLRGESILIATGSSPLHPAPYSFGSPEIYDSDSILALDELPARLAVIGAGVIGSEYACTFAVLGAEVHLIDARDTLLPFLDGEMSQALMVAMRRNGITFHWNEQVLECRPRGKLGSGSVYPPGPCQRWTRRWWPPGERATRGSRTCQRRA